MTVTRTRLGEICVDSGQIVVVDPCYATRVVPMLDPGEHGRPGTVRPVAVTFSTQRGDGIYPVYAEYEQDAEGKRLVRVVIELRTPVVKSG